MRQPVILIRVFVASPTDVGAERDALKSVTDQINHTVALALGVQIFWCARNTTYILDLPTMRKPCMLLKNSSATTWPVLRG